jgi:GT2 family glycosyltransferase
MGKTPTMSEARISVVVPTHQRRDSAARVLHALAHQTLDAKLYEVVLVVDGSTDGTREMAETFAAPYRLRVLCQPNRGRAAACNAGLRSATGSLVVLLDDDMEPGQGFLAAHDRAHAASERLGVVGAVPVSLDEATSPTAAYIGLKFNRHLAKLAQQQRFGLRDFYTGNFSVNRELLLAIGGFDEDFQLYGNEDLELSLRLVEHGVRLVFDPDAAARQHYLKDFTALARDTMGKGRTAVLLATKRPETIPQLALSGYARQGFAWRTVRGALLACTRRWVGTVEVATRAMRWLEARRPPRLDALYPLALDYFYWAGALAALRENAATGRRPASLAELGS